MVAKAIGRPASPPRSTSDDEKAAEPGLRENVTRQLEPLLKRLKNRWVLLALFLLSYVPFGVMYMGAFQDYNTLQDQISAQEAVLALPEPRTDDIETGLRSWTAALQAATDAQVLELDDSELVQLLINAAIDTNVRIDSLSTSMNVFVPVGDEIYDVTPILLRTTGPIAAIESFISVLEGGAVEALEIQNSLVAPQENGFSGTVRALVFNRPIDPSELAGDDQQAPPRRVTDEELDAAAGGIRR